ncbi:MAG: ATP-binding cassette domain-containing protein [Patescibacteria group bacterium]
MPIIEVKNLKKHFNIYQKEPGVSGALRAFFKRKYYAAKAVDNVSFKVNEGELIGFIGPNGAGKTTTLKILSGLLYPTSGEVSVLGFTPWERKKEFQKQFSIVMGQKAQLWWDLPAYETFILNREIYEVSAERFKKVLTELVAMLEVEDILKVQVRKLSLGQRMKCELIAALLHSPKVLFLDEPTIGLDVVAQKKMREFIKDYNQKYHATILLTSHYMEDVKRLCDRVIMIDHGRIAFDGQLSEIVEEIADHKILSVIFQDPIIKDQLGGLGEVIEFDLPRVVLKVPRREVSLRAAQLLSQFNVEDLNIEEPPIEDIIRELFTGRDVA